MDNATTSQDIAELKEIGAAGLGPDRKALAVAVWALRNMERETAHKPLRDWNVDDILALARIGQPPA